MFNHSDDVLREMARVHMMKLAFEMIKRENADFFGTEEAPVECSVTDRDMLLLQIDKALDDGNRELFMRLTEELKYSLQQ